MKPLFALLLTVGLALPGRADLQTDRQLKLLLSHSDLVVTGRAITQPRPDGVYNHFAQDYHFKFRATQTLQGTMKMPRDLNVALNFSFYVRPEKKRPVFPVQVGAPLVLFLFNDRGKNANWEIREVLPLSAALQNELSRLRR